MLRCGRHYVGIVETSHSKFPSKYIADKMKDAPTGPHILLRTYHEGVYLCALGYKFSKREKVSMFIFTRGAGTTSTEGTHYFQRRNDPFGNVYDKIVERPEVADTYFTYCGAIDHHNKQRQGHLRLEKKWITQDPWFRLSTTLIGMHVVDAYQLYRYNIHKSYQSMSVLEFTEVLASQLLHNCYDDLDVKENDPDQMPFMDSEDYDINGFDKYYHLRNKNLPHQLIKNPKRVSKSGKKYHKSNDCVVCKRNNVRRQTTFLCRSCDVPLCSPVLVERTQAPRDCFRLFHEEIFRTSDFSVASFDDIDSYDSEDDFEKKPAKRRCEGCTNEKKKSEIDYIEV